MELIRASQARIQPQQKSVPTSWSSELVGERLVEAYRVVARMPMRIRPQAYGNSWPEFATMTKAEMRQLENELMLAGELEAWRAGQNRTRTIPTREQIERMEQALRWPSVYLREDRDLAMIVTGWADGMIGSYGAEDRTPALVSEGLRCIADGLNRDGVRV